MHSIKNISEINKIDTQSRADAYQCGGFGMFIPDPGSRIPDPKTGTKERGEKKIFVKNFFVALNFTKCN
jgi:hypothetical protein